MKKILVIVGGPVRKLDPFIEAAKKMGADLTAASFSDLNYKSGRNYELFVGEESLSQFDLIYIRVVGKRIEDASLLANYAKENGIRVVDRLYMDSLLLPSSLAKSIETAKLIKAQVPIPKTIYGSLEYLKIEAPKELRYPFVIKSTTGKKAREVWAPSDEQEFVELFGKLRELEKKGARYFAQEFLKISERYRVFIMGGKVIAALVQPTKWRKRFTQEEVEKGPVEISEEMEKLAINATSAVGLDISGVDIMDNKVIEVNAAPSWNLVEKYTGKNMAEEILKFLVSS